MVGTVVVVARGVCLGPVLQFISTLGSAGEILGLDHDFIPVIHLEDTDSPHDASPLVGRNRPGGS